MARKCRRVWSWNHNANEASCRETTLEAESDVSVFWMVYTVHLSKFICMKVTDDLNCWTYISSLWLQFQTKYGYQSVVEYILHGMVVKSIRVNLNE